MPKPPLLCDECGGPYRDERGWRAYLTPEPREVAVFCPACAAREFGQTALLGDDPHAGLA